MHEYGIVDALLTRVEAEAAARRARAVRRVRVRIGEAAGVEIELVEKAYQLFRERGICRGAELEVARVAAAWQCPRCARRFAAGEPLRCEGCQTPARLCAGDEIMLDQIEMEIDDV